SPRSDSEKVPVVAGNSIGPPTSPSSLAACHGFQLSNSAVARMPTTANDMPTLRPVMVHSAPQQHQTSFPFVPEESPGQLEHANPWYLGYRCSAALHQRNAVQTRLRGGIGRSPYPCPLLQGTRPPGLPRCPPV